MKMWDRVVEIIRATDSIMTRGLRGIVFRVSNNTRVKVSPRFRAVVCNNAPLARVKDALASVSLMPVRLNRGSSRLPCVIGVSRCQVVLGAIFAHHRVAGRRRTNIHV